MAKRGEVPRDDAAGTGARRSFHLREGEEDYMPDKLGWGESVPFCERERERERGLGVGTYHWRNSKHMAREAGMVWRHLDETGERD